MLLLNSPRAVITGEYYVCILIQSQFLYTIKDSANVPVDLFNHVAVKPPL